MSLRYPGLLALLIPVLLLALLAFFPRLAVPSSPLARARRVARTWRSFLWWLPEAFALAALALAVVLLAGPERPLDPARQDDEGLRIAVILDRSGSMGAFVEYSGGHVRRLDAVKEVTRSFIAARPRDAFSLVSFARYPETHTPLTTSTDIIVDFLSLIDVPTRDDEDGTAIGDALVLALAHLGAGSPAASLEGPAALEAAALETAANDPATARPAGVAILLTDGQNNQGSKTPDEAAALASKLGIPVYTIALGGEGFVMADTAFGQRAMRAPVDVDEDSLRAIADASGGRFYRANRIEELSSFYTDIATRETSRIERSLATQRELVLAPALAFLLALAAGIVILRSLILRRPDA